MTETHIEQPETFNDLVVDFVTCPACQSDLDGERSEYASRDEWPEHLSHGYCSAACEIAAYAARYRHNVSVDRAAWSTLFQYTTDSPLRSNGLSANQDAMQINIYLGIHELFRPFRPHIPDAHFISVSRESVGYEQWTTQCDLLDKDMNAIAVKECEALSQLASLWGEQCFSDWLHNVLGDVVFQNMTSARAVESL